MSLARLHSWYSDNRMIVMSGLVAPKWNETGKHAQTWTKNPAAGCLKSGWEKTEFHDYNHNTNGFALLTGERGGCTVIDVDDPTADHNKELMKMMECCNAVQKTKKGFHYVFKYNAAIKQTQNDDVGVDTRNDRGCILIEPTICRDPQGNVIAEYKWVKRPEKWADLVEIPQAVMERLKTLIPNQPDFYFAGATTSAPKKTPKQSPKPKVKVAAEEPPAMETSSTTTSASNPADDEAVFGVVKTEYKETSKEVLLKLAAHITNNDQYQDWVNNGFICYNEGLDYKVWEDMSRKSYKFDRDACIKKWNSFKDNRERKLTQATWWKWLKTNNFQKYRELMVEREDLLDKIKVINHNDIAKLFWNLYPNKYVYNSVYGWYILNQHNIWERYDDKNPEKLKNHIADTLQDMLKETAAALTEKQLRENPIGSEDFEKKQKAFVATTKLINTAYMKCGTSEFCNGVVSFLRDKYNMDKLEEVMDASPYVFAFENGMCYDLEKYIVRKIEPEDYVSATCGYEMPKKRDAATNADIHKFIFSIFENEDVKQYFIRVIASCMLGRNRFEEFYTFTGKGSNGKSVIGDVLENTFGKYYTTCDANLFTKEDPNPDSSLPALIQARGKRILLVSESESDAELREKLLKQITGNDFVETRGKYAKTTTRYKATYKPIFLMNRIPKLKQITESMKRRMRIVDFPLKFCSNPTAPNERMGDPRIKEVLCKSAAWRDEFIQMLWDVAVEIKDFNSLPLPNAVAETTGDYMENSNPLAGWLKEHFEITNNDKDRIKASVMKQHYQSDCDDEKFNKDNFAQSLEYNGIKKKIVSGITYYLGLKRKDSDE